MLGCSARPAVSAALPSFLLTFALLLPGPAGASPGAAGASHSGGGSEPQLYARTGDRIVFVADDREHGAEPWVTDGTPAGTRRLADLCPGPCGLEQVAWIGAAGDRLYFGAIVAPPGSDAFRQTLWTSDGTAAGTRIVLEVAPPIAFLPRSPAVGSLPERGLFFFAAATVGEEPVLWVTDGTRGGTRALGGTLPSRGAAAGDRLVFAAYDATLSRQEVWTSDGTPAGTRPLVGGAPAGALGLFVSLQGTALFVHASDHRSELWRSDGTPGGTSRVQSIDGDGTAPPSISIAVADSLAFFVVRTASQREGRLWRTDGTTAGTFPVSNAILRPPTPGSDFLRLTTVGDRVVFTADDGVHGTEPWGSDGTLAGTRLLADLCPGACGSRVPWTATGAGRLVFGRELDEHAFQQEIWESDGTPAGTRPLALPTGHGLLLGALPLADELVYLVEHREMVGDGFLQLWSSTGPGTERQLTDLPRWGLSRFAAAQLDHLAVFTADDGFTGREPWVSDGTPEGTRLLADIAPGGAAEPPGEWLEAAALPGFRFKVRITPPGEEAIAGTLEERCLPETACVAGAVAGRPEVFLRVVGPKGNGYLWPTLVKFTTSRVEVWMEQIATGSRHAWTLAGARPGFDELPGLFDREGFLPPPEAASSDAVARHRRVPSPLGLLAVPAREHELAIGPSALAPTLRPRNGAGAPALPGTGWLSDPALPGFRFQVRVTNQAGVVQPTRLEAGCIAETACVSAALPGRSELFLRVPGPKPNGRLWPTLVRFSTSRVEVWLEQRATGAVRYYLLPEAAPDGGELDGLFDREGFLP